MIPVVLVVVGAAAVAIVWLSVLRAVLAPRQAPPRVARWTLRSTASVLTTIARRLPQVPRENLMALCAPLSLVLMLVCWLTGLVLGFALIAAGVGAGPPRLDSVLTLETAGAPALLGGFAWLSGGVLVGMFTVYLIRVTDAYSRRERLAASLRAQAERPPDAERMVAAHVRTDSRAQLDALFAEWTTWLSDIHRTHVSYPALVYLRPATEMCWLKAATIVLDAAALVEAIAPSWARPYTRALLDTGMRCFERLGAELGIGHLPTAVSLHGREQFGFSETVRVATSAGLPAERNPSEAWRVFQDLRTRYAPYASTISTFLLYHMVDSRPGDQPQCPSIEISAGRTE